MWKSFIFRTFTCFLPLEQGLFHCFLVYKYKRKSHFFAFFIPISLLYLIFLHYILSFQMSFLTKHFVFPNVRMSFQMSFQVSFQTLFLR